ncbi:sciellin isoform X1 [Scomber scombrus]|uniref:Sciellin isoform X1 n=1 Tax=Scomber scombrus TaxID=13677 RepID=A0AAV1NHT7_SCOSC
MSRYPVQTRKSTSPSQAIEDNKKKTSLLKDNSWIRRNEDEEKEYVDRDPNFGKSVLGRYRSNESLTSSDPAETIPTKTTSSPVSVQNLTKRFGGSQDELRSSTLPSSNTSSTYTKRYSSVKSPDSSSPTTTSKTSVIGDPKTSTTTTTVTKDDKTSETTITTTQSVRSPVIKSPTKTDTFTERVKSSSKGSLYTPYSPTRTTKPTETTVTSTKDAEDKLYNTLVLSPTKDDSKKNISTTKTVTVKSSNDDAEDKLYDTLIPRSIKDDVPDSKTPVYNTKTVTVKSSPNGDNIKTKTTTRTSSTAEDDLYDTLLPKGITSPVSTSFTKRSWTTDLSKGDESPTLTSPTSPRIITSIDSPKAYTTTSYRNSSGSDGILSNPSLSKSSIKNVYTPSERTVLEKDLCTLCRHPFTGEAKMILDDMNINCHASCFKCEVCNITLGHMKAGDSMWVYKHMVHCERCFEVTREKWRR